MEGAAEEEVDEFDEFGCGDPGRPAGAGGAMDAANCCACVCMARACCASGAFVANALEDELAAAAAAAVVRISSVCGQLRLRSLLLTNSRINLMMSSSNRSDAHENAYGT